MSPAGERALTLGTEPAVGLVIFGFDQAQLDRSYDLLLLGTRPAPPPLHRRDDLNRLRHRTNPSATTRTCPNETRLKTMTTAPLSFYQSFNLVNAGQKIDRNDQRRLNPYLRFLQNGSSSTPPSS